MSFPLDVGLPPCSGPVAPAGTSTRFLEGIGLSGYKLRTMLCLIDQVS